MNIYLHISHKYGVQYKSPGRERDRTQIWWFQTTITRGSCRNMVFLPQSVRSMEKNWSSSAANARRSAARFVRSRAVTGNTRLSTFTRPRTWTSARCPGCSKNATNTARRSFGREGTCKKRSRKRNRTTCAFKTTWGGTFVICARRSIRERESCWRKSQNGTKPL